MQGLWEKDTPQAEIDSNKKTKLSGNGLKPIPTVAENVHLQTVQWVMDATVDTGEDVFIVDSDDTADVTEEVVVVSWTPLGGWRQESHEAHSAKLDDGLVILGEQETWVQQLEAHLQSTQDMEQSNKQEQMI